MADCSSVPSNKDFGSAPISSEKFATCCTGAALDAANGSIYAAMAVGPRAEIRALWFSAISSADALEFCEKHGLAFVGPATLSTHAKNSPEVLTVAEAEGVLKLSRSTINRFLGRGVLKRLRGTGAVRITRRSVDEYLAASV